MPNNGAVIFIIIIMCNMNQLQWHYVVLCVGYGHLCAVIVKICIGICLLELS